MTSAHKAAPPALTALVGRLFILTLFGGSPSLDPVAESLRIG